MKLQKLTLDEKELLQAVQMFLATQGITCPVHSVSKPYSWSEFEVTFKFEVKEEEARPAVDEAPAAPIEQKESEAV
jgi:hypothetical protein